MVRHNWMVNHLGTNRYAYNEFTIHKRSRRVSELISAGVIQESISPDDRCKHIFKPTSAGDQQRGFFSESASLLVLRVITLDSGHELPGTPPVIDIEDLISKIETKRKAAFTHA